MLPEGAFSADLTNYQFRLLAVICHLTGSEGVLKASIAELGSQTGNVNEKTVRRALVALEKAGFLERTRTRRANGFRGVDTYRLKSWRTQMSTSLEDSNVHASHDYVANSPRSQSTNKPLVPNKPTSYKLKDIVAQEAPLKEIKILMKGYDDGDDLAGFGLLEPRDATSQKISKRDPKTRGKRPEHEWTSMDVAAEFSYRVGKRYPLLPGTVNVKALSGALAKFRKQYGTTALIELELLKMFMSDERNFRNIGDEAPNLYKLYLASFGKKMNQARDNLGLGRVAEQKVPTVKLSTITASDGREFQNSMSGRAQLAKYEKKLKGE